MSAKLRYFYLFTLLSYLVFYQPLEARSGAPRVAVPEFAKLPVRFEPNVGQAPEPVRFLVRGTGYVSYLGAASATSVMGQRSFRTLLRGANVAAHAEGMELLGSRTNYLVGADPDQWRRNVPNYGRVRMQGVYPGIDWVFYGADHQLEYDFVVAAGADPARIVLEFGEGSRPAVDASGDLVVGWMRQRRPEAYQMVGGLRRTVTAKYVVGRDGAVRIALGEYDRRLPLVIDPVLVYGTYLGGSNNDEVRGVAVDSTGAIYAAGTTESTDFPAATTGLRQGGAPVQAFVTKLSPDGSSLVYTTFISGTGGARAYALAVDATGAAYVTGETTSNDFPVMNAFDYTANRSQLSFRDAFVLKLAPTGDALAWSTYLGGTQDDTGFGIAVDAAGSAVVVGETWSYQDFPVKNAFQSKGGSFWQHAFVTKFSPAGNTVEFSTLLSSTGQEGARAVALDPAGGIYLTGTTRSIDFPLKDPYSAVSTLASTDPSFLTKFSATGSLLYSSYIPAVVKALAVDKVGAVYLTGVLSSLPLVNAYETRVRSAWVAKLDAGLKTLVYSTYFAGSGSYDEPAAIAVTATGAAYVAGTATSSDFPLVTAWDSFNNGSDLFLARLSTDGKTLEDSTYIGDAAGEKTAYAMALTATDEVVLAGAAIRGIPLRGVPVDTQVIGVKDGFIVRFAGAVPTVPITLDSVPAGLPVSGDGTSADAPRVFNWAKGTVHTIGASFYPLFRAGYIYNFVSWSDNGASTHDITVGTAAATYTATYSKTLCTYNISPLNFTVGAAAQSVTVKVVTQPGCVWGFSSTDTWIPTWASDGVSYVTFDTLASSVPIRTANLTVAGQTVTVTQAVGLASPTAGTQLPVSATFTWAAVTGAKYWVDVGTAIGQGNVCSSGALAAAVVSFTCNGIPLSAPGTNLYVQFWTNVGGSWGTPQRYIYLAPSSAVISTPVPGTQLPPSTTFGWSGVANADGYWVDVGTVLGQGNLCSSGVLAASVTSFVCGSIPATATSTTTFVQLWTRTAGVWGPPQQFTYLTMPASSMPVAALLSTPAAGSTFGASSVTFAWTAGSGVDYYWLDIGTTVGAGNLSGGIVNATSKTVTGIPVDGKPVYVRLWSHQAGGGWLAPRDYTFTAGSIGGDPRASLLVPAAGSGLGGSAANFGWKAGAGADGYWLDVGTTQGSGSYSNGFQTSLGRTVTGLPCDGKPIWVRLWTRIGGVYQAPLDYTFAAATVCLATDPRAWLSSPSVGSTITGISATFTWTAGGAGVTQYWLDVGTALGSGNLSAGAQTTQSRTVNTLPGDGKPLFVRLWTQIGGVWQAPVDFVY